MNNQENSKYIQWKAWKKTAFGKYSREEEKYFEKEMKSSGLSKISGLKIGELGYGNGSFAAWVRDKGGIWIGKEQIDELQERAKAEGFTVLSPNEKFNCIKDIKDFDAIITFDVIEHLNINEIKDFLDEVHSALKPNGLFMARLPSGDSPYSGAIFNGDITHKSLLGTSVICQISEEHGFDVCQIRPPSLPIFSNSIKKSTRRLLIFIFQKIYFWVIRNAVIGNPKAVISPNMWVVIKKNDSFKF